MSINLTLGEKEYFPNVKQIEFEGRDSDNPLAFKFYNSEKMQYLNVGINFLNLDSYTNSNNISLETLFKLFNSNSKYPFVKYNPGRNFENLYRLYCNKLIARKKTPYLKNKLILKYSKFVGNYFKFSKNFF